jgi:SAM-dependent methyltransferase
MIARYTILTALLTALVMPVAFGAAATMTREQCFRQFSPKSGQAGKDVIWVPTLDELVDAMLKAADVRPNDYVIDLGSGDGKIPIAAAKKFGARAMGIEYNPQMVQLARCYVRVDGLADRVNIVQGDIFEMDFSQATVLTLYLLTDLNLKLRARILEMRPGTRVVSNTFKMGDWSPDRFIESEIGNTRAYMWIVPARVDGLWEVRNETSGEVFRVRLVQHYQELKPDRTARDTVGIRAGKLRGTEIELTLDGPPAMQLSGAVDGDEMLLTSQSGATRKSFTARRLR